MHWIHLAQTIALTGATVHPMTPGSAPLESATVLIEDDRILAVGVDVEIPEDAEELELMQLRELKHGRLAMLATAGFAYQETLTGQGAVEQITSGHLSPFGDGQGAF